MIMTYDENNNGKLKTAMTAAAIGAAVGAAAAVLSDRTKRETLKNKAIEVMNKGEKRIAEAQGKLQSKKKQSKKELLKNLRNTIDELDD